MQHRFLLKIKSKFSHEKRTWTYIKYPTNNLRRYCDMCLVSGDSLFEEFFLQNTEKLNGNVRCLICGKITLMVGNMKQHFEVHHFQREFNCEFCDKVFKTRNSLCVHRRNKHWNSSADKHVHQLVWFYPENLIISTFTRYFTFSVFFRAMFFVFYCKHLISKRLMLKQFLPLHIDTFLRQGSDKMSSHAN